MTPTRHDFLCESCGHTIAAVNDTGKKLGNQRITIPCPKCHGPCTPVAVTDMLLKPTHQFVSDDKRLGVRAIEGVGA